MAIVRYHVSIARWAGDRRYVAARLVKGFHRGPGHSTETRLVAEAVVNVEGMNEDETIASVLEELRGSLLDRLC